MAKRSTRVITMAPLGFDLEDDISCWEFVNPSDAQYSDDSLSVDTLPDDVISLESEPESDPEPERESSLFSSPQPLAEDDGGDMMTDDVGRHVHDGHVTGGFNNGNRCSRPVMLLNDEDVAYFADNFYGRYGCGSEFDHDDDDYDDDNYDYDYDLDLDDELVPRSVSKKLGRQRMRKLGKRVFSKVMTTRTSPYSHLKPGCVRGKHGLGMKFR